MNEEKEIVVPEKIEKFAVGLVEHVNELVIDCDEANADATDLLTRIKMAIKDITKAKEEVTKPLEALKKKFIAKAKVISAPFVEAKEILDGKQIAWARVIRDKERAEQAERDRIEAKRLQAIEKKKKELAKKGIKANLPEPVQEEKPEEKKSVKISGMYSTSNVLFVKKVKLVDLSKVPVKYLLLNEPLANKDIKAGVDEIPGCEIIEVGQNTSRAG